MNRLNSYEIQILHECAGFRPVSDWGAWVGGCLSYLAGRRLVNRGVITELGWAYAIYYLEAK